MSRQQRRGPLDPARRGWCPSLARPMPTGDGLLARVHPPLGMLGAAQLHAVAAAARRYGNGHVDITARGNLQIRGVSEATASALASALADAGLGDVRSDGGPQRLTLTSALAGLDTCDRIDVSVLARAIEGIGLAVPGLPAKTLVAIDGGGRWGLGAVEADIFLSATGPDRIAIGLAVEVETGWYGSFAIDDVPAALGRALNAFVATNRRRMRDLDEAELKRVGEVLIAPPCAPPSPFCENERPRRRHELREGQAEEARPMPEPGLLSLTSATAIAIEAPFGRCDTMGLDVLAEIAAAAHGEVRTTPRRGFALVFEQRDAADDALSALAAADFVVDPADPRRAVAACPGAPACASGTTPVPDHAGQLAAAFAPFAAQGLTAHVSGCVKGCAHPRAADLTLVAENGRYRALTDTAPGDAGQAPHMTFETALDRVRRADPARSLADLFRS